jgi:hypothetical protein
MLLEFNAIGRYRLRQIDAIAWWQPAANSCQPAASMPPRDVSAAKCHPSQSQFIRQRKQ